MKKNQTNQVEMPEYEKQTTESLHKAIYQNKSHTRFTK
jgi:hypothetical protein